MKPGLAPRLVAARLVGRVVREGAWSNVVSREIDLDAEDAGLARHLLYGSLRNLTRIDAAIGRLSTRPPATLDNAVLDVLRVAFHEVLFSRSAAHAVADMAVEAAKEEGHARAAGFVNALVRTLQRGGEPVAPTDLAERLSLPGWVVEALSEAWGSAESEAFFEASHADAPRTVRVRRPESIPADAAPTAVPGAFRWEQGTLTDEVAVQDPASVAVVEALGVEQGERVADVAAAPGGKALAISDRGAGFVAASDVHPRRTRAAARRTTEAGFNGAWVRADATRPPFADRSFDRLLLDAPCTGLGTLRRRPEIKYKVNPGERDRLAALQRRMLEATLSLARIRLVYSVCTVLPEETIGVVEGLGGRPPVGLPGRPWGDGWLMAPHLSDSDGMFICVFDR